MLAVDPVPEYVADTLPKTDPYVALDPIVLTSRHPENEHEESGMLKY